MNPRSRSRSWALQVLYRWEQGADDAGIDRVMANVLAERNVGARYRSYLEELTGLLSDHLERIDSALQSHLSNWRLERLSVIDRCILRIGAAELLHRRDVPAAVVIHEAIRLAERYGNAESGRFVNGVLDAVARTARNGDDP